MASRTRHLAQDARCGVAGYPTLAETKNRCSGEIASAGEQTRGWSAFADHDGRESAAHRLQPDSGGSNPTSCTGPPELRMSSAPTPASEVSSLRRSSKKKHLQ